MSGISKFSLFVLLVCVAHGSQADDATIIDDFAFLTGYWNGTGMGGRSEEVWMPPVDGRMFGIFKQSDADGLVFTELMEITQLDGEFILRLKHFNPDFSAWEEKAEYLTFRLSHISENRAEFGGLRYTKTDSKTLKIELDMVQTDSSEITEIFTLVRD